jgi:diacylglycerol O-acyltransferase
LKQLTGQDASFLYLESRGAHLHLTAAYVYKQSEAPEMAMAFDDIYRHIESRLDTSELFRQKLVRPPLDLDYPYWVDDPDFDLQSHLYQHDGQDLATREELYDEIAALHSVPLNLARAPWEMHVYEQLGVIEGFGEDCFAIVAKYHHAAIDGTSGTQLVDGLHDTEPVAVEPTDSDGWQASHQPSVIELLARAAFSNIRAPIQLARALGSAVPAAARAITEPASSDSPKNSCAPDTRFNTVVSDQRVFHCMSFELEKIRQIRKSVDGATVNDVILAICGGGLRIWLDSNGELPDQSLVAMIPVNARANDERTREGNRLSSMFMPIHTDIEEPTERLQAIQRATSKAKSPASGIGPKHVSDISSNIPSLTLSTAGLLFTGLGLGHRLINLCNCTITNVPGPRSELYMGGAKLLWSIGSAPIIDGMGLIICVFSYQGTVNLSFTSCPEILPYPEDLADCTQQGFDELWAQAQDRV